MRWLNQGRSLKPVKPVRQLEYGSLKAVTNTTNNTVVLVQSFTTSMNPPNVTPSYTGTKTKSYQKWRSRNTMSHKQGKQAKTLTEGQVTLALSYISAN